MRDSAACCVAIGDEVVAVALVEPDFVSASQVREHRQDRSAVPIDDDRIPMPIGRRSVAAEQDLVLRADGHSLREVAVLVRNREARLDLHGLAIDYRNRASWPGADHWNVLIQFPGLRTPLALLEAAGGIYARGGGELEAGTLCRRTRAC